MTCRSTVCSSKAVAVMIGWNVLLCLSAGTRAEVFVRDVVPQHRKNGWARRSSARPPYAEESIRRFLERIRGGGDQPGYNDYYDYPSEERKEYRHNYEHDPYATPGRRREEGGFQDDYYGDRYYEGEQRDYEHDFDDRGVRKSKDGSSFTSSMPDILRKGDRKIGIMMLTGGAAITFLGISLFFNATLLRIGNLLFIGGVPMTIGPGRAAGYFLQPQKARATACLAIGILLVLVKHPIIGMVLEIFGLMNLFGNLFPLVAAMMKQMPIVGTLFGSGGGSKRRNQNYDQDDRYYDGGDDDGGQDSQERYY